MSATGSRFDASRVNVTPHDGIFVVRDDLYPGGTKARYADAFFDDCDELVYATPAQGGAQVALSLAAKRCGKRMTLFVAKRKQLHDRTQQAQDLGAKIIQVPNGYLTVVSARAREYAQNTDGAALAPFGLRHPAIYECIKAVALQIDGADVFTDVWCASGSGTLASALCVAFPKARVHAVSVGHKLKDDEAGRALIHRYGKGFASQKTGAPFPADPTYEQKAWELCRESHYGRIKDLALFWNVCGPDILTETHDARN